MILSSLLNKFLILIFFMSVLNISRHVYYFIQTLINSTDENPNKYIISRQSLILLGLSVSYILLAITTGIKL
jgi:hypothetical protein